MTKREMKNFIEKKNLNKNKISDLIEQYINEKRKLNDVINYIKVAQNYFYLYDLVDKFYDYLIEEEQNKEKIYNLMLEKAINYLKSGQLNNSFCILEALYKKTKDSRYQSLLLYNYTLLSKHEDLIEFFENSDDKNGLANYFASISYKILGFESESFEYLKKCQNKVDMTRLFYEKMYTNLRFGNDETALAIANNLLYNLDDKKSGQKELNRILTLLNSEKVDIQMSHYFYKQHADYNRNHAFFHINEHFIGNQENLETKKTALFNKKFDSIEFLENLIKDKKPFKTTSSDFYLVSGNKNIGIENGKRTNNLIIITKLGTKDILTAYPIKTNADMDIVNSCLNGYLNMHDISPLDHHYLDSVGKTYKNLLKK